MLRADFSPTVSRSGGFGSWYQSSCNENRLHDKHAVISHL
jgi:hypothetical protein